MQSPGSTPPDRDLPWPLSSPLTRVSLRCSCPCRVLWALVLALALAAGALSAPLLATDQYLPACGGLLADPPPGGWQPWSSPNTWGGGIVPGVGAAVGANVSIPCGEGVLLDLPFVLLHTLSIQGALKIKDDAALPLVNLSASFIIVEGRFIIGQAGRQFSQSVEIRLVPNPNNRAPFAYSAREPADALNPRILGHKAFAVVGGQVDFHGLPGPRNMLVWTRLGRSVRAGKREISVRGNVSTWPLGGQVVIAPTDLQKVEDEVATIRKVTCNALGNCTLVLGSRLKFDHFGDPLGVADGFGGLVDETAEVGLLTRRIVVTGTDEPEPHELEGGHFIVYMTHTKQVLEGVQFLRMGQQGNLGRYPLHLHLCGDQRAKSVVSRNVIAHSKQRCVVVHATFNALIDHNIAYNTSGHCFVVEEGGETGNTFLRNLGIRTHNVTRRISSEESDNFPSTFWITNPNNNYIENTAVGSDDSGFWFEFRDRVRGHSCSLPGVNTTIPRRTWPPGKLLRNSVHSSDMGIRTYPFGYNPTYQSTTSDGGKLPHVAPDIKQPMGELGGFTLWKIRGPGIFAHHVQHTTFSNNVFADNIMGVLLDTVQDTTILGSRFVVRSGNCITKHGWGQCLPTQSCSSPIGADSPPNVPFPASTGYVGVQFTQTRDVEDGSGSNLVHGCTFSGYSDTCSVEAAIVVGNSRRNYWNTGHGIRGVSFDATVARKVYFIPPKLYTPHEGLINDGENARMYALRDWDGSVLGQRGYIVARNDDILPPRNSKPCVSMPAANAWGCTRRCYRTLYVRYLEPRYNPYDEDDYNRSCIVDGPRKLGDFSYLHIRRAEDGKEFVVEGNLRQYGQDDFPDNTRTFALSLLSRYTYEIQLMPPTDQPDFLPPNITLQYRDGAGCGQGLIVRLIGSTSVPYQWMTWNTSYTVFDPLGNLTDPAPRVLPHRYTCCSSCSRPMEVLEATLSGRLGNLSPLVAQPLAEAPRGCAAGPALRTLRDTVIKTQPGS